ncbi:hypothetical protein N7488_010927 [Penicillium malachiteum]|nr:hypothetical protein N7488_010927 [Penicillium malachiteum]
MGQSRVRSFISSFGSNRRHSVAWETGEASNNASPNPVETPPRWNTPSPETPTPPSGISPVNSSASRGDLIGSRPASMIFTRNPPLMTQAEDTPPELSPIFAYLNIQSNKVYHEGYFLKLNDQDTNGRPCLDRQWTECYAQLVGTVLSLWDAAALDAAGGEEVPATFINLADASLKMIETLPIRNGTAPSLENVLSLSSAGKNRYLLHFSSFHSLCQWTAAVRLSIYEHTSLYEAYTGALIGSKAKHLNGINGILAPARFKHEDWARVRFGAGTPWRRCWFVINPPDEKQIAKARKALKKSAYDRLSIPVTGNIQFFETRKTKKATPIATVTHVYSAYAIYPQSKALIDQSSLVKLEGRITMHSQNQQTSEGYVFVMPELHAAISGFEMMIRFLFPTFDTFNLYGRPTRLVADTNHIKSLMFAFPQERRFGYLDLMDITTLLQTPGSQGWSEAEWRRQLKEATQKRVAMGRSRTNSVNSSQPRYRSSASINNCGSTPIESPRRPFPKPQFNHSTEAVIREVPRNEPPPYHARGTSDITGMQTGPQPGQAPLDQNSPDLSAQDLGYSQDRQAASPGPVMETMELERPPVVNGEQITPRTPPSPVVSPPTFAHGPRELPPNRPYATTEQRLANNRISQATLLQMTSVGAVGGAAVALQNNSSQASFDRQSPIPNDVSQVAQTSHVSQVSSNTSSLQFVEAQSSPSPHPADMSSDDELRFAIQASMSIDEQSALSQTPKDQSSQRQSVIESAKSVKRKPLPQRQLFPAETVGEPSIEDLRHTLDEDALNRIAYHLPSPVSPTENDNEGSVYDDAASTVSPDYASTRGSVYSKKSQRSTKPRMGVKKTVGELAKRDLVIGDAHYSTDKPAEPKTDIPNIDFGPTMTYMPTTGRPRTADTLRKPSHQKTGSDADRLNLWVPSSPMDRPQSRPPVQEEQRRSMLWHPGMTPARPATSGGGLSAEQYVKQRAAPSPPITMHNRSSSNHTPPPQQRTQSGDWTHSRPGSRMTSYQDANYRPSSRGTSPMLGYEYDVSNHLSAREQEHVARVTKSPFFNMSQDNRKPQVPVNPGCLVGTIDAREREKREMREGLSNSMVQQAIAQRQQRQSMIQQQQQQQSFVDPRYPPGSTYALQPQPPYRQDGMYNVPGANRTWDNFHQMSRADEPRRQSTHGPFVQAPPTPPNYQPSQTYAQHGVYGNPNAHR